MHRSRLVLLLLVSMSLVLATAAGGFYTYTSASSTGTHISYLYSTALVSPSPGAPAITLPGGTVNVVTKSGVSVSSFQIESILHGPYTLKVLSHSGDTYTLAVPKDVVPGDYFLIVNASNGETVVANGVYVMKREPKVLVIAQVTDTHVTSGFKVGYVCGPYFQRDIFKLESMCPNPIPLHSVVATDSAYTFWAMNSSPMVIINTGDNVDQSGDFPGYTDMLNVMTLAAAAGRLLINIKGNHDSPPTLYKRFIGPTYFYETIGKFLIIGLNTGNTRGHPTLEEMKWLNQVLSSHKGYVPIILFHHPYWYKGSKGWIGGYVRGNPFSDESWKNQIVPYLSRYWYSADNKTEQQEIARQFLEDVVKYNVRLILDGHIHHDKLHVFIDGNGTKHWFYTLTATGAPDKETNPPSVKGHAPTWYGSALIYVYSNGTVSLKPIANYWHGNLFGPIISLPVPQEFIVYRYHGQDGTALKFVNEYKKVSGPLVIEIPKGAKVDQMATNVSYKVLGEREIGDKYFMLLNVTIPKGTWQLVASLKKDTQKPDVVFQYMMPSSFEPKEPVQVYVQASDNIGIKNFYAEIYENGKLVSYGKVTKFPAEPATGRWNNEMYLFEIPPLNGAKYTLKITAVDFYNNKYVLTKVLSTSKTTTSSSTTSSSKSSTSSPTSSSSHHSSSSHVTTTSSSTTSSSKSSTSSPTSSSHHKICGPAAIVALAILPLLMRRKR